jgi:CubicO group peptidase (beta-lactamase class C family)
MAATPDMQSILASIPHRYRGPGGSAAVLKDGEVIASRSWGYANLDQRAVMTPDTILPICSISKHMVCLAAVSLCRNPTLAMLLNEQDPWQQLEAELKKMLPHLEGLHVDHLYNMQSGMRDYWAM